MLINMIHIFVHYAVFLIVLCILSKILKICKKGQSSMLINMDIINLRNRINPATKIEIIRLILY